MENKELYQIAYHTTEELKRINITVENIRQELSRIREDLSMLKVKAGVWGVIGGAIPLIVILIMRMVNGN